MSLESIVKRLFLGGTVAVALAVSLMSMQSFAATAEGSAAASGATTSTTFNLTVNQVLTIAVTKSPSIGITSSTINQVNTDTLGVKVTSNTPYEIQLKSDSTAQPALKSGTNEIAAGSTNVKNNTTVSSWGIKKKGGTNSTDNSSDATGYTALTTGAVTFYDSGTTKASGTNGVTTNFTVGVSVTSTQPAGEYTTKVAVSAVAS